MARESVVKRLAARVFGFHLPIVRNGKRHASVVVRLFTGRADRHGNEGTVAALELHVANYREAVREKVLYVDRETGRMSVTLAKLGPGELRRLAYRLLDIADAIEMADALGVDPRRLEEAWLALRRGGRGRGKRAEAERDADPFADVEPAEVGGEKEVFD